MIVFWALSCYTINILGIVTAHELGNPFSPNQYEETPVRILNTADMSCFPLEMANTPNGHAFMAMSIWKLSSISTLRSTILRYHFKKHQRTPLNCIKSCIVLYSDLLRIINMNEYHQSLAIQGTNDQLINYHQYSPSTIPNSYQHEHILHIIYLRLEKHSATARPPWSLGSPHVTSPLRHLHDPDRPPGVGPDRPPGAVGIESCVIFLKYGSIDGEYMGYNMGCN